MSPNTTPAENVSSSDPAFPGAHNVTIRTPRLLLRCMRLSDASAVKRLRSDPEAIKYTSIIPPKDLGEATEYIANLLRAPNVFNFTVELLPPAEAAETRPEIIGLLGGLRLPEVGYLFARAHWSHGYATEALAAFLHTYWATFPAGLPALAAADRDHVMARICAANAASVAVVRKCGFVRVAREDVVVGDGSGRLEELGVWRLERPAGGGGCVEACWMGG